MTFYKDNGDIFQDGDDSTSAGPIRAHGTITGYDDNPSNASVSFTLDANKSAYITLLCNTASLIFGYGTIEWSSVNDQVCSVIAHGYVQYESESTHVRILTVPINDGKPF